jgi:uncharacterized Ntn-hydrolase superfamily protein
VTSADEEREHRQLGVVGVGQPGHLHRPACIDWAGGRAGASGDGRYAIQGNILVGEQVVADMERAWFERAGSPFERRLLAALLAGDAAGGDSRGRQRRALSSWLPVRGTTGAGSASTCASTTTRGAAELARLLDLSDLYFGPPRTSSR